MGDTVLKKTAQILKDKTRSGDCAARFGGEEFIILLPNIRLKPASQIAERIRLAMEEELFVTDNGESFHVTMSVGVTESTSTEDVRKVVQRADKLLYQAKQKGRNCICHSDNFRDSQMNFNSFYNSEANFKIHMSC